MSTQRSERIPELTLGWRLKMALGDMKRDEMAAILGVNPATVSRWMADKGAAPKRAYLAQWAFTTGVPLSWLEHGSAGGGGPTPPGRGVASTDSLARLTDKKMSRARHTTSESRSTGRYVLAAA